MSVSSRRAVLGAFTLVELLVVIGIIGLLVSILLPTLNRVRVSSQVTKCLSNVRQLSLALTQYVTDNNGVLPDAMYNNKGSISPKRSLAEAWTPLASTANPSANQFPPGTRVLPTIGQALSPYLGNSGRGVWECPTGNWGTDSFEIGGTDPIGGFAADDVWLPNYYYMNNKVYVTFSNPSVTATRAKPGFPATDWTVRNIAGLKITKTRTVSGQGPSEVVAFVEYKSFFHTPSRKDVYQLAEGESTKYQGNFGYLDGHAETHRYNDRDGYTAKLHDPIAQEWYGRKFTETYADFYKPENFYPDE